jgi:hypothetical protein
MFKMKNYIFSLKPHVEYCPEPQGINFNYKAVQEIYNERLSPSIIEIVTCANTGRVS